MRELRFNVLGQNITKDKSCDFSGIVAGTEGYLYAKFSFSKEWAGCLKVASFWKNGKEYPAPITNDCKCVIPKEALTWSNFEVSCSGKKKAYMITTNRVRIMQEKG